MDSAKLIKEEPLDWDDGDAFIECDYQSTNMHRLIYDQERGTTIKSINNSMDYELPAQQINMPFHNIASPPKMSENIITVNVAESVKTEDEISFIKQIFAEEKRMHDPALILPTDLEIYAKGMKSPKKQKNDKDHTMHKCRKLCGKHFSTLTERALHETHEHKISPRFIKCNFCNESFENFFALTRHMSEHRHVQNYVCPHCAESFHNYQDLQKHWKASSNCKINDNDCEQQKKIKKRHRKCDEAEITATVLPTQDFKAPKNESIELLSGQVTANLMQMQPIQTERLSFAEEVKAFAAKYQLKTVVARKRTSAFTFKPVENSKRKKRVDYEIEPSYAVPRAINNCMLPLENIKIKEEPADDEEIEAININPNQIQIKNEPHDEYEENVQKTQICSFVETAAGSTSFSSTPTLLENIVNNESNLNADDVFVKQAKQKVESIIKAKQQIDTKSHPKILLSKANLLSMKNVKIFKLGSLAKIVNLSKPSEATIQSISPEEKKHEIQNETKTSESMLKEILNTGIFNTNQSESKDDNIKHLLETLNTPIKVEGEGNSNNFNDSSNQSSADLKKDTNIKNNRKQIHRSMPRWLMRYMEEQPQKQKIIDDLHRELEYANKIMKLSTPDNDFRISPLETISSSPQAKETETIKSEPILPLVPESFFLKVTEFSDKELMIARRQYHEYYYAWICPMCYKEYSQKHTFINHLIGTHKISVDKLKTLTVEYKPFLPSTVKPEQNLSSTQKRENNVDEAADTTAATTIGILKPKFECPKCLRSYLTKQAIIDHHNSNCGHLPLHLCRICSKSFASKSTLNCHMSIHTGELPYQCKFCDKRFRTNGQVRVHLRKHTGEKPFKCQICTSSFTHRETLISHLSRHMDLKRYICRGCNKRFSTISALTAHRNLRPTTCGILELDTQAIGPLIRVTNGQIRFEPQRGYNVRVRRKIRSEILMEIQNMPKIQDNEQQQRQEQQHQSTNATIVTTTTEC